MDKLKFTQAVSRLRVLETRLLDKAKIDRMIDSGSAEEAIKILNETEYSVHMANIRRTEDFESILGEELKKLYSLMYEISPERKIIDIMSLRYDYHNIRVLLKGKALGKDLSYLLLEVGTVDVEKLKYYISNEEYRDMSPIMREAVEKASEAFKAGGDPQGIDIIMDSYMYRNMLSKAISLGDAYIIEYLKLLIDLTNIKTLLRVKKQNKDKDFLNQVILSGGKLDRDLLLNALNDSPENFAGKIAHTDYYDIFKIGVEEFARTGRINTFEKLSDNFGMTYIKKAKYVSFGPEPLLAYIAAKETEIRVIRIIMVGKLNNVASELIRERLRDIYV
jgi:V/A-type H+/Na+-transporting ATPase subunit C